LAAIRNHSIGFVFQFHYLLPEFSCLKNVMIPALKLGKYAYKEVEARAYQKLEILGVQDQALKPASKLSGGQQQRVAVARAIAGRPSILLADEPTGNLDTKNAEAVMDLLDKLHAEGATICMVTHDPRSAERSQRKIDVLDGRVVSDKTQHRTQV
jgi:lipoprotein-releasing system ATP-binding protein